VLQEVCVEQQVLGELSNGLPLLPATACCVRCG
jgi:hypothetical protein